MEKRTFSPILINRLLPLAFGICSIIPLLSRGQSVISPEKVKMSFLSGENSAILMGYDKMYHDEKVNFHEFLAKNMMLRKAGSISLPPSEWGLLYGNDQKGYAFFNHCVPYVEEGERCLLCWMGLRNDSIGKSQEIWEKLKKKYGCVKDCHGEREGIPATWVSGEITFLEGVEMYGGTYICMRPDTCKVKKGELLLGSFPEWKRNQREKVSPWKNFDPMVLSQNKVNNLNIQVSDLAPELTYTFDSQENNQRAQWARMLLLAYEANKHCPTSFNGYHIIKDLPIYVYMRRDGRCEMAVLDESRLSEEDKPFVEELAAAFPQTPPLMFDLQFTIDGEMMPGKILYATHTTVWRFREVNQEE